MRELLTQNCAPKHSHNLFSQHFLIHLDILRDNSCKNMNNHLLDAEFTDGVVHQNHCVFYRHADVPVCPTALVRPVLGTLALKHKEMIKKPSLTPSLSSVDNK